MNLPVSLKITYGEAENLLKPVTHLWGSYCWVARAHPIAELKDVYWQKKQKYSWIDVTEIMIHNGITSIFTSHLC